MPNVGSRGKPGANRRPRPSDRQLIQERARELRELVPNGTEVRIELMLVITRSDGLGTNEEIVLAVCRASLDPNQL
ncbi:hypothetical protein D5086_029504 [Populus alba]|uniref:Uncharacterized protein n=1 Tax=Populus alba TaxID=43335 RepID=A0ACC4AUE2_POPAL